MSVMETTTKLRYGVRDLPTRSVTLFPARAQVVRDIKDVSLKPGLNEISVVGLSPTVDEHSVKVEGSGSAIITDIAVELLPNREIFQDVFPEMDDDESDSDDGSDSDAEPDDQGSAELQGLRAKLTSLRDEQKRATEAIASAETRLKLLDSHGQSLDRKRGVDIAKEVNVYQRERAVVFQDHMDGFARNRELAKDIVRLEKQERRLESLEAKEAQAAARAKAKALKVKAKEREQKRRRAAEKRKERHRLRKELESFWPRSCYTVRITIDATAFTPMSSRRASIASGVDLAKVQDDDVQNLTCDLSVSYVTAAAFWSPSYDLALSTTNGTASLCFDAQVTNMTSETWSNTKMILSTSETSFQGLADDIPILQPWRLRLAGKNSSSSHFDVTESHEEKNFRTSRHTQQQQQQRVVHQNRNNLFGVDDTVLKKPVHFNQSAPFHQHAMAPMMAPPPPAPPAPATAGAGLFGAPRSAAPAPSFAASSSRNSVPHSQAEPGAQPYGATSLFGALSRRAAKESVSEDEEDGAEGVARGGGFDGATIRDEPLAPDMSVQESAFEESGLTTTYDVPGAKTLAPRTTATKQRVARICFGGVKFSHVVVAKYTPVAFLKAKIRNSSKVTLLRGPVGLTLDGAFLGRSSLPRCSASDLFTLSLGIDPAIKVGYAKPEVRRSTSGLFSKEDSSIYTRTITLTNSRASTDNPMQMLVLDQIPVSEDDKLRVELLQPRGLVVGGSAVVAGNSIVEGKEFKGWGKATASLRKSGEVVWDVELNAGRPVRLSLAYEVVLPVGERAMPC